MDPKDNADVVLVRAISVTHVGFFFLLSFASWNWPWDWIESKWQREREIDTKRSGQNESQRVLRREPEGDQGRESDTHMNQRNWGEEGEESEKRCSLLESDSIDLHSMLNHVQHSAHMAPLNVARPESVYACALVYMCIYIYIHVCVCVSIFDLLVGVWLLVWVCTLLYVCLWFCLHADVCLHVDTWIYVCARARQHTQRVS